MYTVEIQAQVSRLTGGWDVTSHSCRGPWALYTEESS